jgi:hypothetical protein
MTELVLGCTTQQAAVAEFAISGINAKIAQAKSKQQHRAFVFDCRRDEYKRPFDTPDEAPFDEAWLSGSALVVYRHCLERGLKPTIEKIGFTAKLYLTVHF